MVHSFRQTTCLLDSKHEGDNPMSVDGNKNIVRRLFEEVWNQGRVELIEELFTPLAIQFDPTAPNGLNNAAFKEFVLTYLNAFPGVKMVVNIVVAEDDLVAVSWTANGIHRGELMGIPPTNKEVTVRGISIYMLRNDKIIESSTSWDTFGMLQQLGAIPSQQ